MPAEACNLVAEQEQRIVVEYTVVGAAARKNVARTGLVQVRSQWE